MNTEIKYKGVSGSPSDYMSPDGELSLCLGAIPNDGELHVSTRPKVIDKNLEPGEKVLMIHRASTQENYITCKNDQRGASIYYRKVGTKVRELIHFIPGASVASATSVGNSIILTTEDGKIMYVLWRNMEYLYLGDKLPELSIKPHIDTMVYTTTEILQEFGLDLKGLEAYYITDCFNIDILKKMSVGQTEEVFCYGESRTKLYNKVFSILNQLNRIFNERGFYSQPFYVRCAYRMYDETHVCHTDPILLVPNDKGQPFMSVGITPGTGSTIFSPIFVLAKLIVDIDKIEEYEKWKDIISGIDVFTSAPLINYTDSAESLIKLRQFPFVKYNQELSKWERTGLSNYNCMSTESYTDENGDYKSSLVWTEIIEKWMNEHKSKYLTSPSRLPGGKPYWVTFHNKYASDYVAYDITSAPLNIYNQSGQLILPSTDYPSDLPLPAEGTWQVYNKKTRFIPRTSYILDRDAEGINMWGPVKEDFVIDEFHHELVMERVDGKNLTDEIKGCSNFYLVSEIPFSDFAESGLSQQVQMKKNCLVNLVTKEQLKDIHRYASDIVADDAFVYNNRSNVIVAKEVMQPITPLSIANPCKGFSADDFEILDAIVEIKENSQTVYKKVKANLTGVGILYFFYPRRTATRLILQGVFHEGGDTYVESSINLQTHDLLNGSIAFNGFLPLERIERTFDSPSGFTKFSLDQNIVYGNVIFTSSVNNPFVYEIENTSVLNCDKITALSSATKAISEGQFGQFPMYAFTSDGVWPLEVAKDGTFSASQPVTRDVCSQPESITQIDDAVIYTTARGIMMLSGASSICISDILDGPSFNPKDYPYLEQIAEKVGLTNADITIRDFHDYLIGAKMVYDYTHQRIIVYRPKVAYAYQFSLKDKLWGMMQSNFADNVNSYPEAIVTDSSNWLVDFTKEADKLDPVFIVTRPIKLGGPDIYKTIDEMYQRGYFQRHHVACALYASNDLANWVLVNTSVDHRLTNAHGSPYKYFRIVVLGNMGKIDALTSSSVAFRTKDTNHMR